jgi:acylglycerol lipase
MTDLSHLFVRQWPVANPKAVFAIVHGFGEHSGRYEHVAKFMNQRGFAVTAYDLPGHGQTPGKRGHVDRYETLLDSVQHLLNYSKQHYPNLPIVLFGHSMGGNILANFLIRRQPNVAAAVVQGAWLRLPKPPPAFELWVAKVMRNIYPSLQISSKLDAKDVSRDAQVVKNYVDDPLNHDLITPGWFFGAFEAQQFAIENSAEISIPTLVMHGTADQLAAFSGSEEFVKNGGATLAFKKWEGLFHELHNEPEQTGVMQFMADWIEKQLVV